MLALAMAHVVPRMRSGDFDPRGQDKPGRRTKPCPNCKKAYLEKGARNFYRCRKCRKLRITEEQYKQLPWHY